MIPNGRLQIPAGGGTYILVLRSTDARKIRIGRLGVSDLMPGCYLYVGSALGPGGVRARVARHLARVKKQHWHIDYLRRHMQITEVWYALGKEKQECLWVEVLCRLGGSPWFHGVGASDCKCRSHFLQFSGRPCFAAVAPQIPGRLIREVVM